MDRFDAMSVLLSVVETGSFSAASRKLGSPLATVSRKIAELEAHLKTRLLNRSTRRLELTDAGRSYIAACKRIIGDVEEAERAAAGEYAVPKGELIVTAPIGFGRLHVLPIVAQFLKAYPDIDIRLMLTDRIVSLLEERVDLAVRIGILPDSSMVAVHLGSIRQVVCASPAYFKEHETPKLPKDLTKHHCITMLGLAPLPWLFPTGKDNKAVPVHSRLTVSTAEAAVDAAAAGIGITRVLSYQMAAMQKAGKLVTILDDFEPPALPVNLVYAGGGILPLKLRAFLDFSMPRLKSRLPNLDAGKA